MTWGVALASIARIVLTNTIPVIKSFILEEVGIVLGAQEEMKRLERIFTALQAVLADAERKILDSGSGGGEAIRNWLMKLNHIFHEIDDILDECATYLSKSKALNDKWRVRTVNDAQFKRAIGRRMKEALQSLDAVAAERRNLHLQLEKLDLEGPGPDPGPSKIVAARETGYVLNNTDHIKGREGEVEEIVDILVNRVKDEENISILPITGLGGLGKTTLAKLVLKDQRVAAHFDKLLWVYVSENFDHKNLIERMIESAQGSTSDLHSLAALEHKLQSLLGQKRYLLVLDDVWNTDLAKWSEFRDVLPCDKPGCSIIITARSGEVALTVQMRIMRGLLPNCELKGLSEHHCWELLKGCAFACNEDDIPELEVIGKQMVKKCGGVPLAAKVLGGLLLNKRTKQEWERLRDSQIWELPEKETTGILPSLILSYHHLPQTHKACFAYCSVFPKGSKIYKREVILLWMAHGYIFSHGKRDAEVVAEEIWSELILKSFFQSTSDGEAIVMHDLLHALSQFIVQKKAPAGTQLGSISKSESNSKIREVNLSRDFVAFPKSELTEKDISSIIKEYKRLRVLDATSTIHDDYGKRIRDFPVDSLVHLRLLNLSRSKMIELPESLYNLWNLQVLNLAHCSKLVNFPVKMRSLRNLRHLFLEYCSSLRETPYKIREMTSLRTLELFIVGISEGFGLDELEGLNIIGKCAIQHLERVQDPADAAKANLAGKQSLSALSLGWSHENQDDSRKEKDEKVLEQLKFHSSVRRLGITGYGGSHFPDWMRKATLVSITISNSWSLFDLSPLEHMLCLKRLILRELNSVMYIGQGGRNAVNTSFPVLEELEMCGLWRLKRLLKEEVGGEMFPKLQRFSVEACQFSFVHSSLILLSNKKLRDFTCEQCSDGPSFAYCADGACLTVDAGESKCIPVELLEYPIDLKSLSIARAHEHCMPRQGLPRLKFLTALCIVRSETLTHLPMRWLVHNTTLETITIDSCKEFVRMSLSEETKHLRLSLQEINLHNLPKMACIHKSIKHLIFLRRLSLCQLPQLKSIPDWLGDLTNLQHLEIYWCPKVTSFPDCIREMKNLQHLHVSRCRELEWRCKEVKGKDWHKIAHIPTRQIGTRY